MLSVIQSRRLFLACLAALGGALVSPAAFAATYQLKYAVPLPSNMFALGLTPRLNDTGSVSTGSIFGGLAIYDSATATNAYRSTDDEADVYGINNSSVVVGTGFSYTYSRYTPFVATPTSFAFIPLTNDFGLPVAGTATAVSNAGLAVGYYGNPGGPSGAAFTYNTTTNSLNTFNLSPVGTRTAFFGVSTIGTIVGTVNVLASTSAASSAAITYNPVTNATFILPEQPGILATTGKGLTSNGTLIGVSVTGTVSGVNLEQGTPFLYTAAGVFTSLTVPAGWNAATIEGFNDHGDFVGALINGGTRVGYVYSNGAYTILSGNNLASGGPVYTAYDINEAGDISVTTDIRGQMSVLSKVAVAIAGDYNGDGFVDAADYTVWADHFGQTGSGIPGDGNNDGVVNAADYTVWADHFGQGTPHVSAVPEPTALAIAAPTALLMGRRRRNNESR